MSTQKLNPSQIADFSAAREHNRQMVLRDLVSFRFCAQDYYFVKFLNGQYSLCHPGTHGFQSNRLFNDYFVGAIIGSLPFMNLHGADGMDFDLEGDITFVEFKLCSKPQNRYGIGPKGGIITSNGDSLLGDASANYEIVNNLASKNHRTIFAFMDDITHEIITVRSLTGDFIVNTLQFNKSTGKTRVSKKRSISLSCFMNSGEEVELPGFHKVGLENWQDRIYANHGKSRNDYVQPLIWDQSKIKELTDLIGKGFTHAQIGSRLGCSGKAVSSKLGKLRAA